MPEPIFTAASRDYNKAGFKTGKQKDTKRRFYHEHWNFTGCSDWRRGRHRRYPLSDGQLPGSAYMESVPEGCQRDSVNGIRGRIDITGRGGYPPSAGFHPNTEWT